MGGLTGAQRRLRWAVAAGSVATPVTAGGFLAVSATSGGVESSFVSITPERILDTRTGVGLSGPFVSPEGRDLQVTGGGSPVPAGATGAVLNVTVVEPSAAGFLSVRRAGTPGPPQTSNLDSRAGAVVPDAVTLALPKSGAIEITYDAFGMESATIRSVFFTGPGRTEHVELRDLSVEGDRSTTTGLFASGSRSVAGSIILSNSTITARGGESVYGERRGPLRRFPDRHSWRLGADQHGPDHRLRHRGGITGRARRRVWGRERERVEGRRQTPDRHQWDTQRHSRQWPGPHRPQSDLRSTRHRDRP